MPPAARPERGQFGLGSSIGVLPCVHPHGDAAEELQRLFPRAADLLADPRFEAVTEALYAPFAAWLGPLAIEPLPDAVAGASDDNEAADD